MKSVVLALRLAVASCCLGLLPAVAADPSAGGVLRFCIQSEPGTLNPLLVTEQSGSLVQHLLHGVLVRVHPKTQQVEPELALSSEAARDGRSITFRLRPGVRFSDGTPFTADDVAHTVRLVMDPATKSPVRDLFRSGEGVATAEVLSPDRVRVRFPAPLASLERLFSQLPIVSARSPLKERAGLGPFLLEEQRPGAGLRLRRNPYYWKKDAQGRTLPYLETIELDIQSNRDIEMARFLRGDLHLIHNLDPDSFARLRTQMPAAARDLGPSLDFEFVWFNQVPTSPLPTHKRAWFQSRNFRRAMSAAIRRADLARLAYRGHAQPAASALSPSNKAWANAALKPHALDLGEAMRLLRADGFRKDGDTLRDKAGQAVTFSIATQAGNRTRERMAALIQQDLKALGVGVSVVPLEFKSLLARFTKTFDYDAVLLGLTDVTTEPNDLMNLWLSSGPMHAWNPGQKTPATTWEAEVDRLAQAQSGAVDVRQRKQALDRLQQVLWEEAPLLFLVHRNVLAAVSPKLKNADPVPLWPQVVWNVEVLRF